MSAPTVLSLFAGIGGLDIGLERAGAKTMWYSEVDSYACRVMQQRFPDAVNLGDITEIDWSSTDARPDIICGGFPCQDISRAGKRVGIDGDRSGLWTFFASAIRVLRPRVVIVENASDLIVRGFDVIASDLAACGYGFGWRRYSAAEFGAPHDRRRTFIVANSNGNSVRLTEGPWIERPAASWAEYKSEEGRAPCVGTPAWGFTPKLDGVVHGIPDRVDRQRCLGNAVVPKVAEHVARIAIEAAGL